MHTVVNSETGRVIVISDLTNTEPQTFTVCIKNPDDWQEMHDYIIDENEIDGIPNRSIKCAAEMPFSCKRSVYEMSVEEAELLRQHPKVEWVEESTMYNQLTLEQRKYDEEFDRHSDGANRFKYDAVNIRVTGDPTPVDNGLLNFTQWGLYRHQSKSDNFGSATNVDADIQYQFTGKNVDIVIMDTGVRWDHPEFLKPGFNQVPVGVATETVSRVRDILIHGQDEYGIDWTAEGLTPPGSGILANYTKSEALNDATFNGSWHGSHVAGTSAGNQFGLAFEANIWSIACVDRSDIGWVEPSDGFDYIKVWHKNKPINPETGRKNPTIVNCSWGHRQFIRDDLYSTAYYRGEQYGDGANEYLGLNAIYYMERNSSYFEFTTRRISGQTTLDELLDDPACEDIILVCSAGNSKDKQDVSGGIDYDNRFLAGTFYYTSGYDSYFNRAGTPAIGHQGKPDAVISVGALNNAYVSSQETLATYTNRGPRVDVFSAGTEILSPWNTGYFEPRTWNGSSSPYYVNYLDGTSMAAPNVTGVLSLYLQSKPNATRVDVRNWLMDHGTALAPLYNPWPSDVDSGYWSNTYSLRDSTIRILHNPYATAENASIEGITFGGIDFVQS